MNMAEGSSMLVNSLNNLSARLQADTKDKIASKDGPYATASQSAAVLRSGAEFRKNRIAAADMLTTAISTSAVKAQGNGRWRTSEPSWKVI